MSHLMPHGRLLTAALASAAVTTGAAADVTIDFQDLPLAPESYDNGSDLAGGFTSGGVHFSNGHDPVWGSWDGFAYSNVDDTTTEGWTNQHAAYTGDAHSGDIYSVAYWSDYAEQPPTVTLPVAATVHGAYFTNTTYAALFMLEGDDFTESPPFEEGDWLRMTVTGLDGAGDAVGSVEMYLADFRSADAGEHFVLDHWKLLDLSGLGTVSALTFQVDASSFFTPMYFAMDSLTVSEVPEPATLALLAGGALALLLRRRPRVAA